MKYKLTVNGIVEAKDYADALRRVGLHFVAWADDTPSDDPDTWTTHHSLTAPQLNGAVTLEPLDGE